MTPWDFKHIYTQLQLQLLTRVENFYWNLRPTIEPKQIIKTATPDLSNSYLNMLIFTVFNLLFICWNYFMNLSWYLYIYLIYHGTGFLLIIKRIYLLALWIILFVDVRNQSNSRKGLLWGVSSWYSLTRIRRGVRQLYIFIK